MRRWQAPHCAGVVHVKRMCTLTSALVWQTSLVLTFSLWMWGTYTLAILVWPGVTVPFLHGGVGWTCPFARPRCLT